jgi:hypothetical protein
MLYAVCHWVFIKLVLNCYFRICFTLLVIWILWLTPYLHLPEINQEKSDLMGQRECYLFTYEHHSLLGGKYCACLYRKMKTVVFSETKKILSLSVCRSGHKHNLASDTGGTELTVGIKNFILQRSQIWKGGGEIGPIKRKSFIIFFLSILYLPLFNSVTK